MFGIIVSGRLVQTNEEPVSENKVIFNIPDADNINHIVVFMTGQIPFPDGFGGADATSSNHPFGQMTAQTHLAQIGISVEPESQLAQQTPASIASTSAVEPFVEFSKKMCENVYNFMSSFALTQPQMTPNPTETFVPLSKLSQWYENFQRRLEQNPYFWRS
ncbi:HIKES-like protein [Mya arenaria]|uniref:HIKES-like protein n=1 Tax=Mya arenaria TaxID=6604 RepID=A0ABY7E1T3_MYAAR|nr:HIKES-like protein [Mya arenaria]